MRVISLQIKGVDGLPDGAYRFTEASGEPAPVVLVTGPPGSGKTRLLDVLGRVKELLGGYAVPWPLSEIARPGESPAAAMEIAFTPEEEAFAGVRGRVRTLHLEGDGVPSVPAGVAALFSSTGPLAPGLGAWLYLPADRRIPWETRGAEPPASPRLAARERLRGSPMSPAVDALADPALAVITERGLRRLRPSLRIDARRGLFEAAGEGERLSPAHLGGSDEALLAMALALSRFPCDHGIVLADTPEAHLGPEDARAVVSFLCDLSPTAQWILATTSPFVLESEAGRAAVLRLGK